MARQKTVYNTSEIGHLWAHQTQEAARNPQNNFSFRGKELFSYSTVIARLVKIERGPRKGETVAFLSNRSYSMTTNRHQSLARQAVPGDKFDVYYPADEPKRNLEWFKEQTDRALQEYLHPLTAAGKKKSKRQVQKAFDEYQACVTRASEFATAFGLKYTPKKNVISPDGMIADLVTLAAKEQQRIAKEKEKTRKAIEKERAKRLIKLQEKIAQWRAGNPLGYSMWELRDVPAMLRIVNDDDSGPTVETSHGANFPVSHALRVLPIVERILERGEEWQTNGKTIPLGHYKLDRIDADGTVHAGCHHIPKDEVLRLIAELKTWKEAEDTLDDALAGPAPGTEDSSNSGYEPVLPADNG